MPKKELTENNTQLIANDIAGYNQLETTVNQKLSLLLQEEFKHQDDIYRLKTGDFFTIHNIRFQVILRTGKQQPVVILRSMNEEYLFPDVVLRPISEEQLLLIQSSDAIRNSFPELMSYWSESESKLIMIMIEKIDGYDSKNQQDLFLKQIETDGIEKLIKDIYPPTIDLLEDGLTILDVAHVHGHNVIYDLSKGSYRYFDFDSVHHYSSDPEGYIFYDAKTKAFLDTIGWRKGQRTRNEVLFIKKMMLKYTATYKSVNWNYLSAKKYKLLIPKIASESDVLAKKNNAANTPDITARYITFDSDSYFDYYYSISFEWRKQNRGVYPDIVVEMYEVEDIEKIHPEAMALIFNDSDDTNNLEKFVDFFEKGNDLVVTERVSEKLIDS